MRAPRITLFNDSQIAALTLLSIGVALYALYYFLNVTFFRYPARIYPPGAEVISPADGKVLYIKEVKEGEIPLCEKNGDKIPLDEMLKEKCPREGILIGIYLSLLDVHFQRSPIDGKVISTYHYKNGFNYSFARMLFRKIFGIKPWHQGCKHLSHNERNTAHIKGDYDCYVVQIADKVVNRIECYVKKGDAVMKGQKYGLIKMGSQVDLFIAGATMKDLAPLEIGARIYGGQTRII